VSEEKPWSESREPSEIVKRSGGSVGGPKKLWVGLGGFSTVVVTLCAVVVFKRVFDADPRDVF